MKLIHKKSWLLIIAFSISLIIWWHISLLKKQSVIISLPVQYINLPVEYQSFQMPVKAKFRVYGNGFNIIKLKLSSFQVKYDASEMKVGKSELDSKFFIINDFISLGISSIEPLVSNVSIETEALIKSSVPIELDFSSREARQQYNYNRFRLDMDEVDIKGPERYVRSVSSIKTQPVTESMLSKDTITLTLINPSKQIELAVPSVDIIRVDEQNVSRIISKVPVRSETGINFFPREITVRISGLASVINSLTQKDIKATLLLAEEKKGEIPINILAIPDVDILDYSPQKVTRISRDK